MPSSHLLLTGGTGLIGSRILPLLLAADPDRVITVLSRKPASIAQGTRVHAVFGDLEDDTLLLPDDFTEILHCAADIRFQLPIEQARAVNTRATAKLLVLAQRCRQLRRFAHVSTAYIQGRDEGVLPEGRFCNSHGFLNSYQQSKYEAEELVFGGMADLPAAIFRLSSVIGHSVTGRVSQHNYFHQILRLIPQNPLPVMPAVPEYRVDLIADDWAAASLVRLFDKHFQAGQVFNICAGPERSMSVGGLLNAAFDCFECTQRPELVTLHEFEIYADRLMNNGARESVKQMLKTIRYFLPHLAMDQTIDTAATSSLLRDEKIPYPDQDFPLRVLDHLATHRLAATSLPRSRAETTSGPD